MTYHPRFVLDVCPVVGCDRTHGVLTTRPIKVSPLRATADDSTARHGGLRERGDASAVARSGHPVAPPGRASGRSPLVEPAVSPVASGARNADQAGKAVER